MKRSYPSFAAFLIIIAVTASYGYVDDMNIVIPTTSQEDQSITSQENQIASDTTPVAPEDQKLLAHWSFDSSADNTTFYDVTGNGFDATCSKSLTIVPGLIGNAIETSGSDFTFPVANSNGSFSTPELTIEALIYSTNSLVNPGSQWSFPVILSFQTIASSVAEGYVLQITDAGKLEFGIAHTAGAWTTCTGSTTLQPQTWYHVTATYDGASLKVYVNGINERTVSKPTGYVAPHNIAQLASQVYGTDTIRNCFKGLIDEVKLFNYALSADSIVAHAESYGLSVPKPAVPALLAHWSFDSSFYNSTFYDVTGNGFDATCSKALAVADGVKGKALESTVDGWKFHVANSQQGFTVPRFTIESLIYLYKAPGATVETPVIFSHQSYYPGFAEGYAFSVGLAGKIELWTAPVNQNSVHWIWATGATTLKTNTWYHVAGTYDGDTLKVYVNGKLDGSRSQPEGYIAPHQPASIACQEDTTGVTRNWFPGMIDELKVFNFALSADSVAAHFAAYELPQPPVSTPALLAHWSFDSSANNSTFYDVTGNGFDATCSKALAVAKGVSGKALESTVTGYTFYAKNSHPDFSAPRFSIEAWVYSYINLVNIPSFYNFKTVFSYQTFSSGIAKGYSLEITDKGRIQVANAVTNSSWSMCIGTTEMKPRTWYHVVGTYDGTALKVYLNGNLENTISQPNGYIVPEQNANIACQAQVVSGEVRNWFNGMIDELKLYDYALDDQAVKAEYERLKPVEQPPFEINLGMKTTYAQSGDSVVMPVYIANHEDYTISALQLTLNYDPEKLTLLSISKDSGLVGQWELFDWNGTTAGSVPMAMAGSGIKLGYGEGELFRCIFIVSGFVDNNDTCVIGLNNINIDENNNLVVSTAQSGKIIISERSVFYGDVTGNSEVTVVDAQQVLKYVVGAVSLPDEVCCPNFTVAVADVSGNGTITSYDASLIFQYSLGLLSSFPVETAESYRSLAKRSNVPADKAVLSFNRVSNSGNELVYDLVGSNLCGFYAGEFAITCNASADVLSRSTITTNVRGATFSSRFSSSDNLLKVAVSSNDDIDDDGQVTIVRIVLPPTSQQSFPEFSIKTAFINEGAIATEYGDTELLGSLSMAAVKPAARSVVRLINNALMIVRPGSSGGNPAVITIWDLQGRRVAQHIVTDLNTSLDVHRYRGGAYIFRLQDGQKAATGRFMLINR